MRETYLIESKHTDKECLAALDDIVAYKPDLLKNAYFGCANGDHTGWATMEGSSESEVKGMLPISLRGKARVIKVGQFTPEQIRSFHVE